MSDTSPLGFGKFVPGFEFLQNLAKGASSSIPQLPNLSHWVAPTISVEELEKRIEELKAVQFWLEQNSRALAATIQALEVQKMTLATLKGMNFSVGDVANAFKLKTADTVMEGVHKASDTLAHAAQAVSGAASRVADIAAPEEPTAPAAGKAAQPKPKAKAHAKADAGGASGLIDPMQWWGALTQQFQQIAASAMKDAAKQTALDTTRNMATGLAKEALKTATGMAARGVQSVQGAARRAAPAAPAAEPRAAAKAPARKSAARKAAAPRSPAKKAARKSG